MEKKLNPRQKDPRAGRTASSGGDAVFDDWLEDKLKVAYSSVLEEPIPDDLIRLISQKLKD